MLNRIYFAVVEVITVVSTLFKLYTDGLTK